MTEIQYLFLSFHVVTWLMVILTLIEVQAFKKEVRQHIDYDSSLRHLRKKERNKKS